MKNYLIFLLLVVVSCTPKEPSYDVVISNVSLIDGTGANIQENRNLYISGNTIQLIDSGVVKTTKRIIDGTGRFLIPGLFDCHVHTTDFNTDFPRFMHFGVTSVFITGGSTVSNEEYKKMRDLGSQDSIPSPRVFHTSQHFTMEGRHPVKTYASSNWREGETVFYLRDTAQISELVRKVSAFPIKGIKLTIEDGPAPPFVARIPQEFVNKVNDEAKKVGTKVFAHVSDNEELAMALKAGIRNIVHFVGIDLDWNRDQEMIKSIKSGPFSGITTLMIDKSFIYPLNPEWLDTPEVRLLYNEEEIEELKYPGYIARAKGYLKAVTIEYGIENPTLDKLIYPQVQDINQLYKEGVNMVLGTDTGNNFIFPGYSLHEEMQLLESGGMEPLDIITMGTRNAAIMLDEIDSLGTLEVGKYADMILLDKNPLDKISNTLNIQLVIKNGRIQNRLN